HGTRRRRELDREGDAAAVDLQLLDEPEADDVAIEIGIANDLQRLENGALLNLHIPKNIVHSPAVPDVDRFPNRGMMIVLAYLWPLALVPLLLDKADPEAQWHAKHGLVLMAAELLLIVCWFIMTSLVTFATFGLGCVLSLFLVFGWVAILGLHVVAILKGLNGGRLIVPGVSEYANRFLSSRRRAPGRDRGQPASDRPRPPSLL